jgi:tetratricopeptide (TPR) repeat protein
MKSRTNHRLGRAALLAAVLLGALTPGHRCLAQDVVTVTTGHDGRAKIEGRIVEYTGSHLTLELDDGRRQQIPAAQVQNIETDLTAAQDDAGARFDAGDYKGALSLYKQAIDEDPRRWMRRRILGRMVWCYRNLGQWAPAGEAFLMLLASDPQTPDFPAIPLAWISSQPSVSLEQSARRWLADDDRPAAVLLGASHLLPTSQRANAVKALKELVLGDDPRIARLAQFQLGRTALPTVQPAALDSWKARLRELPEALRPGPYYVLGRGHARCRQWEDAALALLRTPLAYPQHRHLAARSLLEAGLALEQLGWKHRAGQLYRELLRDYRDSRPAAEARTRLETLSQTE